MTKQTIEEMAADWSWNNPSNELRINMSKMKQDAFLAGVEHQFPLGPCVQPGCGCEIFSPPSRNQYPAARKEIDALVDKAWETNRERVEY